MMTASFYKGNYTKWIFCIVERRAFDKKIKYKFRINSKYRNYHHLVLVFAIRELPAINLYHQL